MENNQNPKNIVRVLNALAVFAFFTWLFEGIYRGRVVLKMETFSTKYPEIWNFLVEKGYWFVFAILMILGIYMTIQFCIILYQFGKYDVNPFFKGKVFPFIKRQYGKVAHK